MKATLRLTVKGLEHGYLGNVRLFKDIELPFVPQTDMYLDTGDDDYHRIGSVTFALATQSLSIIVDDDESAAVRTPPPDSKAIAELVRGYLANGWRKK